MPRSRSPASPIGFLPFMFPVLVDAPPEGGEWHHEVKYDGYRTQIVIAEDGARAYTRNRHDWTERYAPDRRGRAGATLPVGRARWRDVRPGRSAA